jgi:hypothetical protein
MYASSAEVTAEKVDRLYFCTECRIVFLFKSDVDDHEAISGHSKINEMPFD